MDKFNYTMLCDFYELTMGNGYFVSGMQEKISYFDLFFRQIPDGGSSHLFVKVVANVGYFFCLYRR